MLNSYLELSLSAERSYLMFLSGLSAAEISGAWEESKTSSDIDKRSGGWPRSASSNPGNRVCVLFVFLSFLILFFFFSFLLLAFFLLYPLYLHLYSQAAQT